MDLNNALHRTLFTEGRRPQKAKFFEASKSQLGYQALQNRIGTLFDMLTFNNHKNSLNDLVIRISLKRDLGMIPRL